MYSVSRTLVLTLLALAAWSLSADRAQASYVSARALQRPVAGLLGDDRGADFWGDNVLGTAGAAGVDGPASPDLPADESARLQKLWRLPAHYLGQAPSSTGSPSTAGGNGSGPQPGVFVRPELPSADLVCWLGCAYVLVRPPPSVTNIFHPPRAA